MGEVKYMLAWKYNSEQVWNNAHMLKHIFMNNTWKYYYEHQKILTTIVLVISINQCEFLFYSQGTISIILENISIT